MTIPAAVEALLSKKGQIVTMTTQRPMKVRKGQPVIDKTSTFQCRVGVIYDNIAAVKQKREDGRLPAENAGLPWGQWAQFPHLIEHKGEYYLRCTVLRNNVPGSVKYIQNGIEITKDQAKAACLASEFREGDDNDVFTVKVSSVVSAR